MLMIFKNETNTWQLNVDSDLEKTLIAKYKENNILNETSIELIIDAMSTFIETLTEYFMLSNSIGTVINVLTELKNLNNYMWVHSDESSSQNDTQLKKLEQGIKEFRLLLVKHRFSHVGIGRINTALSVPHQLCLGKSASLRLEKIQGQPESLSKQEEKIHLIIEDILTEALKALKSAPVYEQARKSGVLYYSFETKKSTSKEEWLLTPTTLDTTSSQVSQSSSSHSHFFLDKDQTRGTKRSFLPNNRTGAHSSEPLRSKTRCNPQKQ